MNQALKAASSIFSAILFSGCADNVAHVEELPQNILAPTVNNNELRGQFGLALEYDHGLTLTLNGEEGTLKFIKSDGFKEFPFKIAIKDGVMHLEFDRAEDACPSLQDLVIAKVDDESILIPQSIIHAFCIAFRESPFYTVHLDSFRANSVRQIATDSRLVLPTEFTEYQKAKQIDARVVKVTETQPKKESGASTNNFTHEVKLDQGRKHHMFKGMLLQCDDCVAVVEDVDDLESIANCRFSSSNGDALMGKTFSTPKNPMMALYDLFPSTFE